MYFVTRNGHSINSFNQLLDLQRTNGCPALQDKSIFYTSAGTHDDMIDAIDEDICKSISNDISHGDFVGIIMDETTDITIHKKLNIYFKTFKANTCETLIHFMDCFSIPNGKADTIVEAIDKLCSNLGLDLMKVISMASDGASVMKGSKGGVGVKLSEKHNPHLVQIHCVAHRLALCASQACEHIQSFKDYQLTVKNVYRYFHNSAVRYNSLREMESVLNDTNCDTKHVTLKEPASFRWLSLGNAVKAIYNIYPALVAALEHQAVSGSPEAKGLLKQIKNVAFLLKTAFLLDVLNAVNKLCKVFQEDELDVEVVDVMLHGTMETLKTFKTNNGPTLKTVYENIESSKYKDIKLTDTPQSRIGFQNSCEKYLDELQDNLRSRFENQSMDKLGLLQRIFNPTLVPTSTSCVPSHGNEDLESVAQWLGPSSKSKGFIDTDRSKSDYLQFKLILRTMRGLSLKSICESIINQYSELFPDFCVMAKVMLTPPLTSVACERGFSSQNRLKTKIRSSLDNTKLAKLIRILEEGKPVEEFDASNVLSIFEGQKKRRK